MEKHCETCYHHYHNKHTNTICRHALMCDKHDKWEPYTNGDWIRTINNEELARFLCKLSGHYTCDNGYCIAKDYCHGGSDAFYQWLNEAKEDEDEGN